MIDEIILNGVIYDLGNIEYSFEQLMNGQYEFWFSIVGTNSNIDQSEIFIDNMGLEIITDAKTNNIIYPVKARLCVVVWTDTGYEDKIYNLDGTLELLDDCIHYYGTVDLDWNDTLNKGTNFDICMERYDTE